MTRILRRIVHNWPLKLAAVGLATLMYSGLALSQNTQSYAGPHPGPVHQSPSNAVVLPRIPAPVDTIRYFAPTGVPVAASSFLATIDLAAVEGKTGVVNAPDRGQHARLAGSASSATTRSSSRSSWTS